MNRIYGIFMWLISSYVRKERQKWLDLGRNEAKSPFCGCKIDDNDDILIRPCGLHKEWLENEVNKVLKNVNDYIKDISI